jgi:hypothetical protein
MKYLLILFSIASYSQEVILSAGKDEYSIGQVFYDYGGIQFPEEEESPTLRLSSFVYKNNIIINNGSSEYLNYKLFDLTGRLIKKSITRNKESICIDDLAKGVYILKLENETFKIIKL